MTAGEGTMVGEETMGAPAAAASLVCGVDEAGRGPLAGPVFAAAVILDARRPIAGLRDSKALSPVRREALAALIRERSLAWAVAQADEREIDATDILRATLAAMRRAVVALAPLPVLARVDGNRAPDLPCAVQTIVRGDATDASIAAASILAKTARDAHMLGVHALYPAYDFARHKGYPTAEHLRRLARHGPCAAHRRSFGPVRRALAARTDGTAVDGAATDASGRP